MTLALTALLALASQEPAQTPPPDAETIEVRLYVIHRDRVPFDFRNAAALMALRPDKGGGRTIPLEIVVPKEDAKEPNPGQVRQFDGTPYFGELRVSPGVRPSTKGLPRAAGSESVDELVKRRVTPSPEPEEAKPTPADEKKEANGHPEPPAKEERKSPPPVEAWIEEVHKGPYFRAVVPAGDLPAAFDATVTVRSGDQSWTARGFRHPAEEPLAEVVRTIEEDLKTILRHTESQGPASVPVVTVRIRERLERLSGLALRDRALEYSRAWMFRLLDRMDQASRTGDESLGTLVGTFYAKMEPLRKAAESDRRQTEAPAKEPSEPEVK